MIQDLPLFFAESIEENGSVTTLPEESARHIVQVLRMKAGQQVYLTNGKGKIALSEISDSSKKRVSLVVNSVSSIDPPKQRITIAVSLLKNNSRFEWFLEKATELGISRIVPLLCGRTEKQHFRMRRMETILVSAMLQSRQAWLPELSEPVHFMKFIEEENPVTKFIAWCGEGQKNDLLCGSDSDTVICIGPEGDFMPEEINAALSNGYQGVTFGRNRLRSETAALTAAVTLTR